MTIWVKKKKKFAKGPEVCHVGFVSPEKHCSEVLFAGLLFVFKILCMQTTLSFLSGIFWRSIVIRKTKETFCFAKGSSDYNTIVSHCCFVSVPNRADSNFVLS